MTEEMEAVYDYIVEYAIDHNGNSPSVRRIMHACDHPSTSRTSRVIDLLVESGKLERKDGKILVCDAEFIVRG